MITAQKMKLLLNDPKFYEMHTWSQEAVYQALKKIYAAQKQIHRGQVIKDTTKKLPGDSEFQVKQNIDLFLERINHVERKLVLQVENAYYEKEKIHEKYSNVEIIYNDSTDKLRELLGQVQDELDWEEQLTVFEKQVAQIKQLHDYNNQLKRLNAELKKRIQMKRNILQRQNQ